jgi:DNA-binding NarL/FixJ family response regulator
MIRILIVDDNQKFRRRLIDHLITLDGIGVVGEAATGEQAISQTVDQEPDLILMDVRMGGMNGLIAMESILKFRPDLPIIILSKYDLHEYREAARLKGAAGYVVKMHLVDDLIPTIKNVLAKSNQPVGPKLAGDDTAAE